MKNYLVIEADCGDGDYVEKISEVPQEEMEIIKAIIALIKWEKDCDFPHDMYAGLLTEEQIEIFNQYVPRGTVHTIKSIRFL